MPWVSSLPSSCQLCRRYHTLALNHKTCRRTWPQEDRDSGRKTLSGKRGITGFDQGVIKVRFGRPNWDTVFPAAKEAHGGHPIGTAPNPQAPNPRFFDRVFDRVFLRMGAMSSKL